MASVTEAGPRSAARRASSTESRAAASRGRRPRTRSSTGVFSTSRVRRKPPFSRSSRRTAGVRAPRRGRPRSPPRNGAPTEAGLGGEGHDEVVAVAEGTQDEGPRRVAEHQAADLPHAVGLGGLTHRGQGEPLVGPDEPMAVALHARAGLDHHLAVRVEEQGGERAGHGGEQPLEETQVGHAPDLLRKVLEQLERAPPGGSRGSRRAAISRRCRASESRPAFR